MDASDGYRTLAELLDLSAELGVEVSTVRTSDDGDVLRATVELELPRGGTDPSGVATVTGESGAEEPGGPDGGGGDRVDAPADRPGDEPEASAGVAASPGTGGDSGRPDGDEPVSGAGGSPSPDIDGEDRTETEPPSGSAGSGADDAGDERPDEGDPEDSDAEQFYRCTVEGCERAFGTEHGMRIHVGRVHADDSTDGGDGDGDVSGADPPLDEAVDLPDGLTVDDLQTAVEGARTLREVATDLGLERDDARDLLAELGLLEMVHGRVATADLRERSKAEIRDRLRRHASGD